MDIVLTPYFAADKIKLSFFFFLKGMVRKKAEEKERETCMKKILTVLLCAAMVASLAACGGTAASSQPASESAAASTLTGTGKGFGGPVTVTVTMEGDKIVAVEAAGEKETNGIGTNALEQLPAKIVEANSADVEVVSGATVTSEAIIYAVKNAMDPAAYPAPEEEAPAEPEAPAVIEAAEAYMGFGLSNSGRIGPGKDDTDTQVYSFNQVFANVLFDGEGKILDLYVDQLEVSTPNYDGASMPHFSGFPGQGGYNLDSDHDAKVDGKTEDTEDNFNAEIASWTTKRERGADYVMGTGTWSSQMDKFQQLFVGMTVEEVEDWFAKYCADSNGRPLKDGLENAEDKAKYDALTDEEKAMLADVTSAATMSLQDSHGDILTAIKNAYENRVPLDVKSASGFGFGLANSGRIGPGKDDTGTQVYSFNEVYATTLFDAEGKIAAIYVDQLEVSTPNYDGASMPHFSGFPGQGGYNLDSDHDAKVDGKTEDTEDNFNAEIASWTTKRERGADYVMGTGTWSSQMDKFQQLFVGKTVDEVADWFAKYCADSNGRPLKDGLENAEDKAKYDALTDEEKAMLADVTSAATMSLQDSHGDILSAIKASFENKVDIQLTLG